MGKTDFRPFVPTPDESPISGATAREHGGAIAAKESVQAMMAVWKGLLAKPFKGITADGNVVPGLYALRDEAAPTAEAAAAAGRFAALLSPEQRAVTCFEVGSSQWRDWQNTELYVEELGLRLDDVPTTLRDAAMDVVRASLSTRGYEKSIDVMRLNRFLGDLVGSPAVMNEWSYIFCLFGTPSTAEPWGWHLFGHHLCLNCFMLNGQMTLTPTFMGAEPAYADEGPYKGLVMFEDEERIGLDFIRSMSSTQKDHALLAHSMVGGDLPEGRRMYADGLHYGGAYQDNRIIPYEGLLCSDLAHAQQDTLLKLIDCYTDTLPDGPRTARMTDIERHMTETRFCWIGGLDENTAFYYRIQSPVIMIEFDHHAGVYLTNSEPANFHVHSLVRTPNGNDYGRDLLRLHYEHAPHHKHHE